MQLASLFHLLTIVTAQLVSSSSSIATTQTLNGTTTAQVFSNATTVPGNFSTTLAVSVASPIVGGQGAQVLPIAVAASGPVLVQTVYVTKTFIGTNTVYATVAQCACSTSGLNNPLQVIGNSQSIAAAGLTGALPNNDDGPKSGVANVGSYPAGDRVPIGATVISQSTVGSATIIVYINLVQSLQYSHVTSVIPGDNGLSEVTITSTVTSAISVTQTQTITVTQPTANVGGNGLGPLQMSTVRYSNGSSFMTMQTSARESLTTSSVAPLGGAGVGAVPNSGTSLESTTSTTSFTLAAGSIYSSSSDTIAWSTSSAPGLALSQASAPTISLDQAVTSSSPSVSNFASAAQTTNIFSETSSSIIFESFLPSTTYSSSFSSSSSSSATSTSAVSPEPAVQTPTYYIGVVSSANAFLGYISANRDSYNSHVISPDYTKAMKVVLEQELSASGTIYSIRMINPQYSLFPYLCTKDNSGDQFTSMLSRGNLMDCDSISMNPQGYETSIWTVSGHTLGAVFQRSTGTVPLNIQEVYDSSEIIFTEVSADGAESVTLFLANVVKV